MTQGEYNVTTQRGRTIDVKINLLNYNFQVVDELSGVTVSEPSFSNNATSDIRRTCSISLTPKNSSFDIKYGNKIWLDKYVQIFSAIKNVQTDEYEWTNMGIYIVDNPTRVYSATDNTITIQGLDLMAKLTGLRNGNMEGMDYIIKADSNVRESIIAVLAEGNFTKYAIEECPISVPNEIRINSGGTLYDILKALRDILPQYQMYFDVDGVFHYNLIPSGKDEQVMVTDSIWKKVLIDYQIGYNFDIIKNVIEVYGKTHDIKNFGGTATVSNSTYTITIASLSKLRKNIKIGFVAPSKVENPQLSVIGKDGANLGTYPIQYVDGTYPNLSSDANKYYVVKLIIEDNRTYFYFMGEVSPSAKVEENNPNSPFYVDGTFGKVRQVFQGGEYDNIYTDELALDRAKWELYNYCRLQDNITINCVPIYWLDVNWLVEITLPNERGIEETNQYIIKQINTTCGVSGVQNITMMKYYPFYETF